MTNTIQFKRLTVLATLATFFLIFVGGLVRVSGAGLGCPDWPKCFGRWIPPVSVEQLPRDIDPSLFNFTLAWIEYINRLNGVVVGLLILLVALYALVRFRSERRIVVPSALAAVLTAYQGWQGGRLVESELEPALVSIHMLVAVLIASLLVYAGFQAHRLSLSRPSVSDGPSGRRWLLVIWLALLLQMVLGTQMRAALEHAALGSPLLFDSHLIATLGLIKLIHPLFGVVVFVALVVVAFRLFRRRLDQSPLLWQSLWTLGALGVIQLLLGAGMLSIRLEPVLQVLHMWVSAIMAGVSLVAYLAVGEASLPEHEGTRGAGRMLALLVAAMIILGFLAAAVAGRAERSRADLPILGDVPAFEFTAQWSEPFGRRELMGKLSVVFFGFANCKGPCPVMAAKVADLYHEYDESDLVQFVKVSVDPARDTLQALQEYARDLGVTDHRWAFLLAPIDSVAWLCEKGFMMAADNLPMGHSTKFVLVDQQARIRGYYDGMDDSAVRLLRGHIRALARDMQ